MPLGWIVGWVGKSAARSAPLEGELIPLVLICDLGLQSHEFLDVNLASIHRKGMNHRHMQRYGHRFITIGKPDAA